MSDNGDAVNELKRLVSEAAAEVNEQVEEGTCVKPRYTMFLGRRIAEHRFDKWKQYKDIAVYTGSNKDMASYRIEVYKRRCTLCGKVEVHELAIGK